MTPAKPGVDEEWEATRLTIDVLAPPAARRAAMAKFAAEGWEVTAVKTNMATMWIEIYGKRRASDAPADAPARGAR